MVNTKAVKRQRRQGKRAARAEQERQLVPARQINEAISTRQINAANRTEILTNQPGTLHVLKVQTGLLFGQDYFSVGYIEDWDYRDELTEMTYVTRLL